MIPLLLLASGCRLLQGHSSPPLAVKGVLDLSRWDLAKSDLIVLNGEYAFYWGRHVPPADFTGSLVQAPAFVKVPGFWSDRQGDGGRFPGQGYATYRLKVLLPGASAPLALRLRDMGTAFRVFVNGRFIGSTGVPGENREATVPGSFPQVMPLHHSAPVLDIVFHVSNFHHRRGGIWEAVQLGPEEDLREMREARVNADLFVLGSFFIIALSQISLFFFRKNDRAPLYFGLFCIAVAVRVLTTGEKYLTHLFPAMSWDLLLKLEYLSMSLAVASFALFVQSLFVREFSRIFYGFVLATALAASLIILVTPVRIFSYLLPVCQALLLLSLGYGFVVLYRALRHGRKGTVLFLIGFGVMSLAVLNDIVYVEHRVQTGYFAAFGVFVFIFSQFCLLSFRFSSALNTVEVQRRDLAAANEACEQEIRDRTLTEAALRQSEEKYRLILESIEEGYFEVDLAGNLTFFNEALCRVLGYAPEGMRGLNNRAFMRPETAQRVYETFNQVFRTGEPAKAFGWEVIRPDGGRRYLESSISLIRDGQGMPTGFRGLARDLTDRREAEDRERQQQQQLQQASKMVELGTLVSGVAHEVNNPNNFIMLNAPLLGDAWQAARPILEEYYAVHGDFLLGGLLYSEMRENIPRLFSGILEGSERIRQIVEDLKNYVRPDTSDLGQSVDLNEVVRSALSLLANMVSKATDRLSVELENNLPAVKGNFQRLEQVVINLVQNACQALPDRKKGLRVSTRRDRSNDLIVLQVQDEGLGIPPENLPHVTDPFFSTKHESGGVGLGLAISARIIKDHGGSLQFFSEPGAGTTAEITLPLTRAETPEKKVIP
ncbi:MAG: PAS domain S-box protein [Desulfobacterota bacterium]|nr:PAS domain S-box protein [Thermodesulfobacteriota bacterium]